MKEGKTFIKKSDFLVLNQQMVLFSIFEHEDCDFIEFMLSFSNQVFHRGFFSKEIEPYAKFVDFCFGLNSNIMYSLCSYELNGYLLSKIATLAELREGLLLKFPLVFTKKNITLDSLSGVELSHSVFFVNHAAQRLLKD